MTAFWSTTAAAAAAAVNRLDYVAECLSILSHLCLSCHFELLNTILPLNALTAKSDYLKYKCRHKM